jgi:hypothetical protein
MLLCDTLECIEKKMVGINGYETSLLPKIKSCIEMERVLYFGFNDPAEYIGFTWKDTSTIIKSKYVGRACYQHTSSNPYCQYLLTDYRSQDEDIYLSTFIATSTHYYSDQYRTGYTKDEGAKILPTDTLGTLVPLNSANGRTGKAILMSQFIGSGSTNHDDLHMIALQMRVENEILLIQS